MHAHDHSAPETGNQRAADLRALPKNIGQPIPAARKRKEDLVDLLAPHRIDPKTSGRHIQQRHPGN
jgi:hypothetical protein